MYQDNVKDKNVHLQLLNLILAKDLSNIPDIFKGECTRVKNTECYKCNDFLKFYDGDDQLKRVRSVWVPNAMVEWLHKKYPETWKSKHSNLDLGISLPHVKE